MSDITMQEIADKAGVSRATVSRVLTDPDKVKPETRERIRTIIESSGYMYHAGAAELIKRRSFIIGLLIPSVHTTAFGDTILAVQEAANELGMAVILGCSEFNPEKEEAILNQFLARRVAGVVMIGCSAENEAHVLKLHEKGIPCVIIWTSPRNSALNQVGFDNISAAMMATRYLAEMGHERIALISGPLSGGRRVEERVTGYKRVMQELGLPIESGYISSVEPTIANGETETLRLLESKKPPTAIFAASDILAIGALSAARKIAVRVPEDLSVLGFDDIEFSSHTNPPLTTVSVPAKEMSRVAVQIVKQLINKEISSPKNYWFDTVLIVRKSCAPPKR